MGNTIHSPICRLATEAGASFVEGKGFWRWSSGDVVSPMFPTAGHAAYDYLAMRLDVRSHQARRVEGWRSRFEPSVFKDSRIDGLDS